MNRSFKTYAVVIGLGGFFGWLLFYTIFSVNRAEEAEKAATAQRQAQSETEQKTILTLWEKCRGERVLQFGYVDGRLEPKVSCSEDVRFAR
jgi:hypothetical protein